MIDIIPASGVTHCQQALSIGVQCAYVQLQCGSVAGIHKKAVFAVGDDLACCAGGGGKTLAMAARARLKLYAHDASPGRMRDLTARATRAGVKVILTDNPEKTKYYDLILTDVPCSGSGSWRRDPQGKLALDAARLAQIQQVQAQIMDRAAPMVAPGGVLAYATCSLLHSENAAQVAAFLARHSGWRQTGELRLTPLQGADGFYLALLTRA